MAHLMGGVVAVFLVLAPPAQVALAQNPRPADEATYKEFEQVVADMSVPEKIQAWEAYLKKYPRSAYVARVKQTIAQLKGGGAPPPAKGQTTTDPELSFLNESPSPTPAPQPTRPAARAAPARTPEPSFFGDSPPTPAPAPLPTRIATRPTPTPAPPPTPRPTPAPFLTDGASSSGGSFLDNPPHPTPTPRQERVAFNDPPTRQRDFVSGPPRVSRPRPVESFGRATHTEVAGFVGIAPDETYVRNTLLGVTATQRFGRIWAIEVEGCSSQPQETALLASLRALNAQPEVISKYNFLAGGGLEANLLSAIDPVSGEISERNDLYAHAGGGVVNTNLEICKQNGATKCSTPLFINGVNFAYASFGLGHRFYVAPWLALHTEIRGRVVFELIDNVMSPRTNVQIDLGPSITF